MAVIKEMQEKIDSLTAEVTELRSNVTDLRAELQLATSKIVDGKPAKLTACKRQQHVDGSRASWKESDGD